jgi:hypothetical protein
MKTNEILANINSNGGFDNFRKWKHKDLVIWVKSNYNCSTYIANRVAYLL